LPNPDPRITRVLRTKPRKRDSSAPEPAASDFMTIWQQACGLGTVLPAKMTTTQSCTLPARIALGAVLLTACGARSELFVGTGGSASSSSSSSSNSTSGGILPTCVVAPWTDVPAQLTSGTGNDDFPPGAYTLRYGGGGMIHDPSEGYEVTAHYVSSGIACGHHLYNGADPSTSTTSVWLGTDGLVGSLPSVAAVEQDNAGHTWSIQHAGGPLFITYLDDYYGDNQGPGTQLCIAPSP
jgi:hypothetical protein